MTVENDNDWWTEMHARQLWLKDDMPDARIVFIGASVIQHWTDAEIDGVRRGKRVWDAHYLPRKALNFGIGGNTTEDALWRMRNGALDGIDPQVAVVAVGFNNATPPRETADGLLALLREIRLRCRRTHILFQPYLPSTEAGWRQGAFFLAWDLACADAGLKADDMILPLELTSAFVNEEGLLKDQRLVPDNVHPAEPGYQLWYEAMEPTLSSLLAR
jgi:beta-glucosidase